MVAPDPCHQSMGRGEATPLWGEGRAGGSRGLSREGQKERPEGVWLPWWGLCDSY